MSVGKSTTRPSSLCVNLKYTKVVPREPRGMIKIAGVETEAMGVQSFFLGMVVHSVTHQRVDNRLALFSSTFIQKFFLPFRGLTYMFCRISSRAQFSNGMFNAVNHNMRAQAAFMEEQRRR